MIIARGIIGGRIDREVALSHQRAGRSSGAGVAGSAIGGRHVISRLESYLGTGIWERRLGGSVTGSIEDGAEKDGRVFNRSGDEDGIW